jgi:hypothetical protein
MRTGVPCNENRFFPVRIDLQGLGLQCGTRENVGLEAKFEGNPLL